MDALKSMFQDMADMLKSPLRSDMPIGQLILIFVLFVIVATIVFDSMRILKAWMDAATEAVIEATT